MDNPISAVTQPRASSCERQAQLAVNGGDPIVARGYVVQSKWPRITEDDIEALLPQLRSGLLTEMQGQGALHEFESSIAMHVGTKYALATNSGTAALHCALSGVGVQSGDEVIVPALSFIACAAAVLHHQAIPIFADVDPITFNVTPESVRAAISRKTKAIIAVHLHGLPADMDGLVAVGKKYGIAVVEDYSQAFGAEFRGRPVGGIGDAGAASLMAGKNLPSAGEAGVVTTNSRCVRNRAAQLKCFGEEITEDGSYRLQHDSMGWNYRINILSATMVLQQLFRLEEYNSARRSSAEKISKALSCIPGFTPPTEASHVKHVYHMYRFRFDPVAAGLELTADQAREGLKKVFWAEGLPLVEFQNMPLPGHALMSGKVGYGRGCPWKCHGREDVKYDIQEYPGALNALRHTLVIGYPAQAVLCNEKVVSEYIRGFVKLQENINEFARFASALNASAPWEATPRLF